MIEAQGYVPVGAPLWEYDNINPGIIDGLLVAQWKAIYDAVLQARNDQEIPFKWVLEDRSQNIRVRKKYRRK